MPDMMTSECGVQSSSDAPPTVTHVCHDACPGSDVDNTQLVVHFSTYSNAETEIELRMTVEDSAGHLRLRAQTLSPRAAMTDLNILRCSSKPHGPVHWFCLPFSLQCLLSSVFSLCWRPSSGGGLFAVAPQSRRTVLLNRA